MCDAGAVKDVESIDAGHAMCTSEQGRARAADLFLRRKIDSTVTV